MLHKIILGTANFTQPYGILGEKTGLLQEQVLAILSEAISQNIYYLDTAFGYGDLSVFIKNYPMNKFQIITKFSVLESYEVAFKKFAALKAENNIFAALVHDPQNISAANLPELRNFICKIREEIGVQKVGVSAYELKDVEAYKEICTPDIIQIPFNPLNQMFNQKSFIDYVRENDIEVHGRSLFLQGVLLSDSLPENLAPLHESWSDVKNTLKDYPSRLCGLLNWAFHQTWIDKWILGVASIDNLREIASVTSGLQGVPAPYFHSINHPLSDPRNWSK